MFTQCRNCAGPLTFDPTKQKLVCGHCGSEFAPEEFKQSEKEAIEKFKNKLEKYGINVTIRREMGRDINGACGQLRKSYNETKKTKEGES